MVSYQLINACDRRTNEWGVAMTTVREMQGPGCIPGTKRCHRGWLMPHNVHEETAKVWDFLMRPQAVAFGVVFAMEVIDSPDVNAEISFKGKMEWYGWC